MFHIVSYLGGNISILNSSFRNVSSKVAGGVVYVGSYAYGVSILNSTFKEVSTTGDGGVIRIAGLVNSTVSVAYSNFTNIKSTGTGGVISIGASVGDNSYIRNSSFVDVFAGGSGGIIYIETFVNGTLDVLNSSFKNVSATSEGGVVYVGAGGVNNNTSIIDCNFTDIYTTSGVGGIARIGNVKGEVLVLNSNFTNVSAGSGGGIVYIVDYVLANVTVSDSRFRNISSKGEGGIVYVGAAGVKDSVFILNSNFTNISGGGYGGIVRVGCINGSFISLNSSFVNISSAHSGIIFYSSAHVAGNVSVFNSTFMNVSNTVGGYGSMFHIVSYLGGNITILNSNFTKVSSKVAGGVVYVGGYALGVLVLNSTFTNISTTGDGGVIRIGGLVNSSVFVAYSNFTNISSTGTGGFISIGASVGDTFSLVNSTFTNISATTGGLVYTGTFINKSVFILDSTFTNISATSTGGVINIATFLGDYMYINNSTFTNISATGSGGAVLVGSYAYGFSVRNSTFVNVSSNGEGGVIYTSSFVNANVIILDSYFTNVSANSHAGVVRVGGVNGNITVQNSTFLNVSSMYYGIIIYSTNNVGGYLSVLNSSFINDSSRYAGYGSLFYITGYLGDNFNLTNSTFYNITSRGPGGIISVTSNAYGGSISNSTFTNVYAGGVGGIVCISGFVNSSIFVEDSNFTNINTTGTGGVISIGASVGDSFTFINSNFTNISATGVGGVVYIGTFVKGNVSLIDSNFTFISAVGSGGIFTIGSYIGDSFSILNSSFANISATDTGGVVYIAGFVNRTASILDSNFDNISSGGYGGIFGIAGAVNNFYTHNSTFNNISANSVGGAFGFYSTMNNLSIVNSSFFNVSSRTNVGGIVYIYNTANFTILNSTFINNSATSGSLIYAPNGNGTINNNIIVVRNITYNVVYTRGDFNYNWWGLNTPNWPIFVQLGNIPETNVVMGFNNLTPITPGSSSAVLCVSLNSVYNRTSDNVTHWDYDNYMRNVFFNTTIPGATFANNYINITENITNTINYGSLPTNWLINATIDYQTLFLGPGNIEINFTVSTNTSALLDFVIFNISITSQFNFTNVSLFFDSIFLYANHTGYGTYNSSTGEWFIGNLNEGIIYNITIRVRVPYNESLVNTYINHSANLRLIQNLNFDNPIILNKTLEVLVLNKSGGSYSDLQWFIDMAPNGTVLDIPFDVTYDPINDAWLRDGMRLNKTLFLNGSGHIINGTNLARHFLISECNVTIFNLTFVEGNYTTAGSIYTTATAINLNITNSTFYKNWANSAGTLYLNGQDTIIDYCNFINNTCTGDGGGAVFVYNNRLFINNSLFENNSAGSYGGAIRVYYTGYITNITNSVFVNNYAPAGYGSATCNVHYLDNNWWGNNTPELNNNYLIYGNKPETWVVMDLLPINNVLSTGGGSVVLSASLSKIYNRTSGNYTDLIGTLPTRYVSFDGNFGSFSINGSNINITGVNTTLTYPSISLTSGLWINATIDNQTINLPLVDLNLTINVSNIAPSIATKFIVYLNITNNGPFNITYVPGNMGLWVNFTIPYPFIFVNSSSINYINYTGLWILGNLSVNQSKLINITLRIPNNETFIGSLVNLNATALGHYLSLKPVYDNVTVTIMNKTSGSYTDLQELIDATPAGGTVNVPFHIIYDPEFDGWLQAGMRLNKTITVNGNGFNISGLGMARHFIITAANVTINNLTFVNGTYGGSGGSIYADVGATNLTIANSTFRNNTANGHGGGVFINTNYVRVENVLFINNYATSYGGGLQQINGRSYLDVYNCTFLNNRAGSAGGGFESEGGSNVNITYCTFINNTDGGYAGGVCFYAVGGYSILNYCVIVNTSNPWGRSVYGGSNINYNWWGSNNPNFAVLTTSGPESWVVMDFLPTNNVLSTSGGSVVLLASLNKTYNRTTNNFTDLTNELPARYVSFDGNFGSFSINGSIINITAVNTTLTYPSIPVASNLWVNATIDNQTINLPLVNLSLTIGATNYSPSIASLFNVTLNITNNGPFNITYAPGIVGLWVNFTLPYPFIFVNSSSSNYSNITGLWLVGNLSVNESKFLNITVKIPYNTSFIGYLMDLNATSFGHYLSLEPVYDNMTLNITNLTAGSYTLLQEFIDATPNGSVLNVPFHVVYDPLFDGWLQAGMRLNKTITVNGNGFNISGLGMARHFIITAANVTINNLTFVNGTYGGSGGSIYADVGATNLTIANSTFRNNTANGHGGGVFINTNYVRVENVLFINNYATSYGGGLQQINGRSYLDVYNCTFLNNRAGSAGGGFESEGGSNVNITYCTFINNTDGGYAGGVCFYAVGGYSILNYCVIVNTSNPWGRSVYGGSNINYNWWGSNNPNFAVLTTSGPESWFVMNFTNITPIYLTAGSATLNVTLNTIYNKTSGNYTIMEGDILPARTVVFNWTLGSVSPVSEEIINNVTSTFTYPANMTIWRVNATIDNQTLWLGSTDLGIYINASKNPVDDGDNITINVTIVNNGIMDAFDVNITITLPYGFILNNYSCNSSGVYNNTTSIWHFDVIHPGENFTLTLNATLADPGPYLIINATIENNTSIYEENLTNNTYLLNVTVIQWSDLEIHKNLTNTTIQTRNNITYVITVFNNGPSTANNVTVFDNLSDKLIYVSSNATNGYYNETTGIWFMDNITPYTNETLNLTVMINNSGFINNFVNVSCLHNDTNWTNNYDNISFETPPVSDLWVTIDMEPQTSNYITFHIQAGNNGFEDSNGTIVEFNISSLMVYINHTTDGGVYGCSTQVWDIGYLRVNETVNMTLIVQLDFPAGLNVTNITTSVNITSWGTDLYLENNTDNVTFEAEIYGNFRLLQQLIDNQLNNTVFVLPRSFAYDPINDAFIDGVDTYDLINGVSIYKNLTIVNPDGYTIGGFEMARCLNITANGVVLDGLKIVDGYSPLGAGLNIPASNVKVLRSNFTNNVLWGDYGGAIYVGGSNVLIQDNYFNFNNASKLGGGVGAIGAINLQILNNTFVNNSAKSDDVSGGAVGLINSTATVNYNVFLDNNATSSSHIGSTIYTANSTVNLEANWYGNNTPDMITNDLIAGIKPETWVILDWEFVNPNMAGVDLNVVFVLYNSTNGEKTKLNKGLPYRKLNVTSRDPTLSTYNTTFIGSNSVNYTYNTAIPVYEINATVDYETISLEFSTLLNIYKTLINDTVWFGDDLIYNVTIINYGPHNTLTIIVEDLIPPGLTINNIIKTTGSTSQIGDKVYWGLVMPAGTSTTLLINTTPSAEGSYVNNITVNRSTDLDYFINGTNKTATGQVLHLSDLEVNLTISDPPHYVGENIVYNLRVANYGPSIAYNITVNMPVSSGLTYLYQDWPGTYSQATGLWNISSLNPGDILDINITFRINNHGWYNQTVNITSDSVDVNTSNNNKTVSFIVTDQVDLVLNMTINKGEALYGDNSIYLTLNILNKGPSPADNVTIFLYYPGLDYWYAAAGYGSFINDTPTAGRWIVGTLNANASTYIVLRFVANTLGNFTINGRANNTHNDSYWPDNYYNLTINVVKYADLTITKTASHTNVYVGQVINYTITVTNLAGFTAENVIVTDSMDSNLIYDGSNPNFNGTHWFVGNLSVGETRNITINVTINESGYLWNNATVNSSINDSNPNNNRVNVWVWSEYQYADLRITKTTNKTNPFLCENVTFTITVTNYGAYNATNVTVYDPLPIVLLYDGNNPDFNGTHWFVGNLTVGETKNITYIATVDGVGIIWNNATVNSSIRDPNPGNNHAEVYLDVPVDDDLRIFINVIPNPPQANNAFIINISVWNRGFKDNNDVTVEFHLPSTLAYVNSTQMGAFNWVTGFWDIGYLPNGAWTNLEIVVYPLTIDNITLECNVSGSVTDIAPWNNRANITFEIVPAFDLTVTKTALNSSITDGDDVAFEINVWNSGPNLARNVEIIDYLPYGTLYVYDNSSGVYNNITRTVNWTIPILNVGDNLTFYLILKSWGPGLQLINKVNVSAYGTDSNITDNTATATVNVTQKTDLEILLNASKIKDVDLGETITFYITVINHGPSNTTGVIANFTLPSNFIYVWDNSTGSYNPFTGLWTIGNLAQDSNITLRVNATLNTIGLIKLNATVNGTYNDNDTSNNIAFLNITATPVFDLNITAYWNLTDNTMPWNYLGNYTVIVSNKGPDNATNVTVRLVVPGVNYVSHTGAGILNTTTLIWNVGNLTVGEYKNITITFNATTVGFFITRGNITGYGNDNNTEDNNYTLNLTIIPVVDLVMTNITVNTTVTCVDGILEFNVTVFNRGPCNATNTTIVPFLPTGWTVHGGMLVGNVPVNKSEVFTILVNATTLGNFTVGFNATINGVDTYPLDNNLTFETIEVIYACDLMITIKTNTISTITGDIVVYVITVSNLDWRTAHNVTANVTIPSNLIFDHMYLASGNYNPGNGTWTIGNLSYRNSTSLFLFTRAVGPGPTEFWVNVSGDDYDFHLWNNNDTVNIMINPGLDLNITIIVDNSTPYTGSNVTFKVIVENIGLINAENVFVDLNIPSGFINPSSGDLNFTGASWFVGNLNVGSVKTLNFTLVPASIGNLTLNVSVDSNRLDYNLSNNFANITVSPIAATDLSINITCNNSNPMVNEIVTYTITIKNNGLIDANNVLVYNNLPFSLAYATSTPTYSPISRLWLITNLTAGTSETLNITINHTLEGIYNYTANITCDAIETDTTNNIDNITITINNYNDLITIFEVNTNTILDEDILNFTITVYNNGTYNNTNVKVYTNLPNTNTYTDYGFFDTNLGIWNVGNLTSYENKTINILVNITQVGNYTFWANSTGDQKDRNNSNNNQSLNITIYTDYDITVNITVNNNSIYLGDTLNFTITVTNHGPSTTHNTNITHNITGTTTTINIGDLNKNETRTYNIIHTPTTGGIQNYQVNITADNLNYDRNTTNNYDNITINITIAADLILNINANTTLVNRGDYVEFNITIYNNATNTANNVIIEYNKLFEGTILSSTVTNGFISPVSWFIPTLTPYTTETLTIRRTIDNNTLITTNASSTTWELNKANNYANITINITKLTDLEVTLTVNQTNAYLGDNITFTVTVINHGNDTAENVTVHLDLPYSTQYSDTYMYDSLNGIWNIGTLENNTNKTLNITVTLLNTGITTYNATVNTTTSETNITNNHDNITVNITNILDLEITIISNSTDTAYTGELAEFIITVTNHGPSNATNTIVNINLPGTIFTPSKGTYTTGTWNIGTLTTGEKANLTIQRTLQPTDTGIYTINVTSNELDKNTTNNNATINLTVNKTSDLEIRITASTLTTDLGNIIFYTINVINNGPDIVNSAIANINLPGSFNIQTNMSNNGIFNGTHWILSTINPGLAGMATLIIYGNYTGYGNQTTKVNVSSQNHDNNLTNNNANISVWIIPACDLIVNFTTTGHYNPDGTMTFNITVTNIGPCNTTNVTLYTNLPITTDYNETYGYFDSIQNIWYIGDLNAGQSETLIINTTMISRTQYYANVTSPTKELNTTNNIKYINITVTPIVDLSVNITVNNTNPLLGESITFLVTATNLGYYNATNVTVYTNLPSTPVYLISKGLFDTVNGNWSIGKLDVGETATLQVTINATTLGTFTHTVNITGSVNDTKTNNNNATITYTVNATTDIGIKVNINQTSLILGDNVTFTVNISNYGPSDAENITIELNFPTGFIIDPITLPTGTYSNGQWNITLLTNSSNITLNITGILNSSGTHTFSANITNTATYDTNTTNNYDSVNFNINDYTDLTIKITSNNYTVFAGDTITLTINVTNYGPGNAENITVNTGIYNATSTKTSGYYDKNTRYWFIENLTTNTTTTLTLTLQITENTTYLVTVNTTNIESNLTNNNDTINITVNPLVNLNITVNTNSLVFYENDTIIYTITVTNNGYSIAENVNATINIPFLFTSANSTNYDNLTGTWNIGNLSPKETQTLTLKYQANTTGNNTSYFNTTTTTLEFNLTDNNANITIFVDNTTRPLTDFVDLIATITVDNSTPTINSTITFNITIYNNATLTANNITITNYLPTGLTPIGAYPGIWTINNLTAYENYSFTFSVNVTNYSSFVDNVTVDCNEWDINPTNNRANQLIIVSENKGDYLDLIVNITRVGNVTIDELITYNITVTNQGPSDAIDVNCTIGLFEGLNLTNSSSTDYNETLSLWNVGNLSSGSSKTLTITLNITSAGLYTNIFLVWSEDIDKNPQNNLALDTFEINDTRVDVNIRITANRTYGKINDTIQFTVTVVNPSNNPATDVNVTLDIPTDLEIINFTGYNNGSYYIGTLNSTQTVTFNFTAKINTTSTATISVNVTINETDHNLIDNADNITITAITGGGNGVADLKVNLTSSLLNLTSGNMELNQYPEYGDVPYFTIYVTNYGPDNATNVKVPLTVPNGCSIMAQDAYWDNATESFIVSNLSVNQTIKLEVSMLIETTDVLLINTTATSDQLDPNITDNTATISMYPFIPEPKCDLNVTVKLIGNEFHANSTVTFNITIRNDGDDIAYNVTVRNTIPTGLILRNITTYDAYTLTSDGWDIAQILPGASMQFLVSYNITKKGLYQTTVNANSTIQDIDPTTNGMGVAFYAGEAEPPRREVKTKVATPSVTLSGGKVKLNGGSWTFSGKLQLANNTASPSSYSNFEGQTLYANVTGPDGITRTYTADTVTGSDGKATFTVPNSDILSGENKYTILIWYKGEKTGGEYYLSSSNSKANIKVVA